MRLSGTLILLTILLSLLSPLTVHAAVSPDHSVTYLVTLDVCHAPGSPVSVNTDTPSLHESPGIPMPFAPLEFIEACKPVFVSFLFSFPIEQPPRF